jgi:hypothetical protein
MITSCKNWKKQVKTQKSTNNLMSIFGLIKENMELSHIHLAVLYSTANVLPIKSVGNPRVAPGTL